MKNKIFVTEEGMQEIQSIIDELQATYREYADWEGKLGELKVYKELLESAVILNSNS